jgi:flagellar biogenesis protein FliO
MLVREATYLLLGLLVVQSVSSAGAEELAVAPTPHYRFQQAGIQNRQDDTERQKADDAQPATQILPVETFVLSGAPHDTMHGPREDSLADSRESTNSSLEPTADSIESPSPALPLPPRERDRRRQASENASAVRSPLWTVASSLTMVVGLFLLTVWGARKHLPQAATPLPEDVIRVLGRAPLAHRQTMQLVRLGNKLVLLCVTPQGAETLAEIHDRGEVDRLTASCDPNSPDAMSATFRHILAEVRDPRFSTSTTDDEQQVSNPFVRRYGS